MSAKNTQKESQSKPAEASRWRLVARFAVTILLISAILFVAAGRVDWIMGWVYVGVTLLSSILSRVLVARRDPDLLLERSRSLQAENVKAWDRRLVPFVAIYGPMVMLVVAGLTQRFGWPPRFPLWAQLVGLALVVLGTAFATWAMVVNRFFSGTVRIQHERGHHVINTGPYRWIRHPGYVGGILAWLGGPLLLDSAWAFIPAAVVIVLTILRTALEDRTLRAELPGYQVYADQVRYRLLPGVW